MSLTGALFTGVTGLNAQSQQMAAISDNLANINTTGYKRVESRFSTLVTDGSSANTFSPGGVRANPTTLVRQQGLVSTSESATDLERIRFSPGHIRRQRSNLRIRFLGTDRWPVR
jgi:flagellar hook protein FlgE